MFSAIELLLEQEEEDPDQSHLDGEDSSSVKGTPRNPSAQAQPRIRDGQEVRNATHEEDGLYNTVSQITFETTHGVLTQNLECCHIHGGRLCLCSAHQRALRVLRS
jgi:hypothetical protein